MRIRRHPARLYRIRTPLRLANQLDTKATTITKKVFSSYPRSTKIIDSKVKAGRFRTFPTSEPGGMWWWHNIVQSGEEKKVFFSGGFEKITRESGPNYGTVQIQLRRGTCGFFNENTVHISNSIVERYTFRAVLVFWDFFF